MLANSVSQAACFVCANSAGNRCFKALEMMYGSREEFEYLECSSCGCVQLLTVPDDLGRFYPESFSGRRAEITSDGALKRFLKRQRALHWMR